MGALHNTVLFNRFKNPKKCYPREKTEAHRGYIIGSGLYHVSDGIRI